MQENVTPLPTETPQDSDSYLEALIADYGSLRSDFERLDQAGQALLAVAVTITAALGAFLVQTCDMPAMSCVPKIWPPLYAFIPAIPFAIILLFADLGNAKVLKMYYTRTVEAELRRIGNSPEVRFADGNPIRLPAYGDIAVGFLGQHRGRVRYRFTVLFVYIVVGVLYLATTSLSLWIARPIDLQIALGAVYALAIVVVLRITWFGGTGARRLWREATRPASWIVDPPADDVTGSGRATGASRQRSILKYLIIPRPHEMFARFWIIPAAWICGGASVGGLTWIGLLWILAATVVFEFLFYQARYIINDLRSIDTDAEYSDYKKHNRFPTPARASWIRYSLAAVVARIGVGVWAMLRLFPTSYALAVLIAAAALAVQCAVYESLRAVVSRRVGAGLARFTAGRIAIFVVVGLGYLIRGWLGFALGGAGTRGAMQLVLMIAAVLAFGTMAVTMAWALSSVTQIVPPVGQWPSQVYRRSLLSYTHLGPIARQAGLLAWSDSLTCADIDPARNDAEGLLLRKWPLLEGVSSLTWWNTAAVIFCGASSAFAVALYGHADAKVADLALASGLVMGFGVVKGYGILMTSRWIGSARLTATSAGRSALCIVTGSLIDYAICFAFGGMRPGIAAACGFAFASANYLYFRRASAEDVEVTLSEVITAVRLRAGPVLRQVVRYVIGDYASRLVMEKDPQK